MPTAHRGRLGFTGRAPSSPVHAGALHPSGIDDQASRFLLDVRLHLWSSLVIPSIALRVRNR